MKRLVKVLMLAVVVGACFTAASCPPTSPLYKTWAYDDGYAVETFLITSTLLNISLTGGYTGTAEATLDSHDEAAGHFQTTLTDTTGYYASLFSGITILYWTYAITSGQLFINWSDAAYPASPGTNPFDSL
ncbi:MAG: hypothetical protein E4H09_03115 [Spirochaetales bacterium]|nr:MAG: hypothetical protein E4H09_03115 [Spirochaetales bacterium]